MRLVLVLVSALVAAGCVTVPEAALDAASVEGAPSAALGGFPDPLIVDHDHGDLALHQLATDTMSLLSRVTFEELAVPTPAFGEADLLGDSHLVVSALLNGFYVVDVADPAKPVPVSYTPMPGFIADVKSSESGNFVFLGIQLAGTTGVQAYNVAVRERPVPAGFFPMEGGCHMLAVHKQTLYCAPNDATVRLFEIVETPGAVALLPVSTYTPYEAPTLPIQKGADHGDEFTHDMTVQDDPLTGSAVMYVSFWELGLRVVDVSDRTAPKEIGAWTGEGSDVYEGNVHTAMAGMVGDKRVIVVIPEYANTPSVTFIDATDYSDMRALGVWAPKSAEEYGDSARSFSTHNFQFLAGKVYMAMYHGGVWVIDASTPERLAHPVAVGYYLPSDGSAMLDGPTSIFGGGSPNTWDVVVKDGVILASDIVGGLYALSFAGDDDAEGLSSFA